MDKLAEMIEVAHKYGYMLRLRIEEWKEEGGDNRHVSLDVFATEGKAYKRGEEESFHFSVVADDHEKAIEKALRRVSFWLEFPDTELEA
jgi:hypothetical protein